MADKDSQAELRRFLSAFKSPGTNRGKTLSDNSTWECMPSEVGHHISSRPVRQRDMYRDGDGREMRFQRQVSGHNDDDHDDDGGGGDPHLDAFDRELLAQLENERPYQKRNEPSVHGPFSTPVSKIYPATTRGSNVLSTPPIRGLASSPSELGPPSSPSIRFKGNRSGHLYREEFRDQKSSHWPSTVERPSPGISSPLSQNYTAESPYSPGIKLNHAPPIVQGIQLVPTHELPDRFSSIFSFPVFNAIQSKCFHPVYHGDHNLVLSSPTGSGKTVIMELAICRLVSNLKDSRFKVVYQAPTKSLCSERFRDWREKFAAFNLQCAELTGDTDHNQLRNVQHASIIITTPEKWDSMTRKWKDHVRLMQLVKLFLIDEVHILKETRGATLEAVVSRMKSVDSNVRFIALSATVPNSEDIATWLGKDSTNQHLPAHRERFGEEFRPVKLQKFVYGYQGNGNDFAFDRVCESKLPDVITKHSRKKPIMIFCCTRNSAITTSKNLAKLWTSTNPPNRLWGSPTKLISVQNPDLRATISAGVAFHHAGLDYGDRTTVEKGFLDGQIHVICCTSTLAVGVNLPCYLVIVKNTVTWQDNGCKEYADLEMMQMLGRAGRPQFDDSAVAVILTRKERVGHYEKLVAGSEPLESCLHLNLIDHLNAEIGLGTVNDVESATKWLTGTFFFVRLQRNPSHYKLKEGGNREDEEVLLRQICEKDLNLLQECSLVTSQNPVKSTELGDAMARYYVKFQTMKLFLSLPPKAKMSEILSVIAQGDEFREIRLKVGEKSLYKEINKGTGIKFPIKDNIALAAHKISLLIQSELGAVEMPTGEQYQKHRLSFHQDRGLVFSHVSRLIRCIIDCQISRGDSVGTRHALELARSLGAKVWDNSALQMKQIEQIGIVAVRKLANAGINSIDALEAAEPLRIETILSRNPPFGMKLLAKVAEFPKPRVSIKQTGKETKPGKPVRIKFKADIGFINEKAPSYFHRRLVYVCFLAETSDGRIIDFRRFSANKLQKGHEILLSTDITNPYQTVTCSIMCDEIAGTMRQAELKPDVPQIFFPLCKDAGDTGGGNSTSVNHAMNISRRRSNEVPKSARQGFKGSDEFYDDVLDDGDLIAAAEALDCIPANKFNNSKTDSFTQKNTMTKRRLTTNREPSTGVAEPAIQLDNGRWACNHRCKDKTACKHLCCREGTDRPPKVSKKPVPKGSAFTTESSNRESPSVKQLCLASTSRQREIPEYSTPRMKNNQSKIEVIDLTENVDISKPVKQTKPKQARENRLNLSNNPFYVPPKLPLPSPTSENTIDPSRLSFIDTEPKSQQKDNTEVDLFDDFESVMDIEEFPSPETLLQLDTSTKNGSFLDAVTELDDINDRDLVEENLQNLDVDDTNSFLENELTDYEGYLEQDEAFNDGTSHPKRDERSSSISSPQKQNGKCRQNPQPSAAIAATNTGPSPFSESYSRVNVSGNSLFCSGSSKSSSSSFSKHMALGKRTHGNMDDENVPPVPCKKGKLSFEPTSREDPKEKSSGTLPDGINTDRNGWEGIDLSVLEEFKDVAEFY